MVMVHNVRPRIILEFNFKMSANVKALLDCMNETWDAEFKIRIDFFDLVSGPEEVTVRLVLQLEQKIWQGQILCLSKLEECGLCSLVSNTESRSDFPNVNFEDDEPEDFRDWYCFRNKQFELMSEEEVRRAFE